MALKKTPHRMTAAACAFLLLNSSLLSAQTGENTGLSYALINSRVAQNQSQFYVYEDVDSPFNHGFPSGLFGSSTAAMVTVNPKGSRSGFRQ